MYQRPSSFTHCATKMRLFAPIFLGVVVIFGISRYPAFAQDNVTVIRGATLIDGNGGAPQ